MLFTTTFILFITWNTLIKSERHHSAYVVRAELAYGYYKATIG